MRETMGKKIELITCAALMFCVMMLVTYTVERM